MKTATLYMLLMLVYFCFQVFIQADAEKCPRTNKKHWRYCLDKECSSDSDCEKKEKCLCDGDCGLSCVKEDLKCDILKPRNAKIKVTGVGFQQTVTYSCKDGYTLRGPKKRVCRGIGKWDGKTTRCPMLCKDPGDIQFGNKNGHRKYYKVGSTVDYWCFDNYEQQGSRRIQCTKQGAWNTQPPKCTLPTCSKPVLPQNAHSRRRVKSKYTYNEIVSYSCDHGYFTAGSRIQKCTLEGKWSTNRLRCIPKSCGDPGTPLNGRRVGYVFTFKNKVYYECYLGYVRLGPEFRQCQSNQKWSDDTPTCEPADCGRLPAPQYGEKIEETKRTYQGRVTFQCKKEGYELKGSRQRVCQSDGRWDGTLTTCKPVECKDPGKPNKGGRNPDIDKYVYENRVDFQCKKNHTLQGDAFIICQKTKTWTGSVPKCLAPCLDPDTPKGGRRHHHSFLHNNVVRFSCNKGWKMNGEHTIRCTDGKWDYSAPKCLEGCAAPRQPSNGNIYPRKEFFRNEERTIFYCFSHYKRVGERDTTCRNGKWSNTQTSCKRICGDPGSPYNGWRNGNDFFEGKQVTFTCKKTHDLIGLQAIQCLDTGRWSGPVPVCKKRCSYNRPANSQTKSSAVIGSTLKHGTTLDYSCHRGYTLVGQPNTRCDDGRWRPGIPQCKASCSDPGPIQHGQKIGSTFTHRSVVSYVCNDGYTLDRSSPLICNDGQWDRSVPICKESCRDPGVPPNSRRNGDSFKHGHRVSYTCRRGTQLVGSSRLTCNFGRWSSEVPRCLEICNNPRSPANGYKRGKRVSLSGDKITFYCDSNYDLVGSKEMFCDKGRWNGSVPRCLGRCKVPNYSGKVQTYSIALRSGAWIKHDTKLTFYCNFGQEFVGENETVCSNGHWSNVFPECKVPCNAPDAIPNGRKRGSKFKFEFECNPGHTLVGSSTIYCVRGIWSESPPRCLGDCVAPRAINNGYKTGNDYRHEKWISFGCNVGYKLNGKKNLKCDDGQWSDNIPTCIGVCPDLVAPSNGALLDNNYESGATVRFRCNNGFTLRGPRNITCNNKQWNNKPPACKADCIDPGIPKDGQRQGDVFSFLSIVNFTCNNGLTLIGPSQIQCRDRGWTKSKPVCEANCQDPGSPPNTTRQFSVSTEGRQTVAYSCTSYTVLIGQRVLTCINGVWSHDLPICSECGSPLGMESRTIPDTSIRASTQKLWDHYAKYGRLNNGRAWCSRKQWSPYLEIDLGKPYKITYLATQGSSRDNIWVTKYIITHNLARSSFIEYRENTREKLFPGNTDATSVVKHRLTEPFIARKLRFLPFAKLGYWVIRACMRVEVYGCDLPKDCVMVGSRVLGKWDTSYRGADQYFKAYMKTINEHDVQVEIESQAQHDQYYKTISKKSLVLDIPPKRIELRIGTKVLAPWSSTYYAGKITNTDRHYYLVKADDGDTRWFTIEKIRRLKVERFCER